AKKVLDKKSRKQGRINGRGSLHPGLLRSWFPHKWSSFYFVPGGLSLLDEDDVGFSPSVLVDAQAHGDDFTVLIFRELNRMRPRTHVKAILSAWDQPRFLEAANWPVADINRRFS